MRTALVEVGDVFGKLTVIERNEKKEREAQYPVTFWRCRCECGKIKTVCQTSLRAGKTKSCGCLKKNSPWR